MNHPVGKHHRVGGPSNRRSEWRRGKGVAGLTLTSILVLLPGCNRPGDSQTAESLNIPGPAYQSIPDVPARRYFSRPEPAEAYYHTVAPGETLGAIARRYGVAVGQLQAANGFDADSKIYPEQLIFIPGYNP